MRPRMIDIQREIERIEKRAARAGLTPRQFAERAGVDFTTWWRRKQNALRAAVPHVEVHRASGGEALAMILALPLSPSAKTHFRSAGRGRRFDQL